MSVTGNRSSGEHVSSDDHQMSLALGGGGGVGPMSDVQGDGGLMSQCIIGNGHIETPLPLATE